MTLFFDYKFRFHTSKMNEIYLHCHWLYFSCVILSFGQGGTAPEWKIDMVKLYFMVQPQAKIVSCYGGPDQGDARDVWIRRINANTTTILKYVLSHKRSAQGANSRATAKKGLCVLMSVRLWSFKDGGS